jgi:MoaA/NifB/PqqE/SkfB family radical SAM enzyme
VPLETPEAERLLAAVASGGARAIVFAGGDPSLRKDLGQLLAASRQLVLRTEVHTNAQHAPDGFRRALTGVDCVGLSLDGSTAASHDEFRSRRGNFERVLELLGFLDRAGVPVIVRTVVSRPNFRQVADLGGLLLPFGNILFWYLLEFSSVGTGYVNRRRYELERTLFDEVATDARSRYGDKLQIHVRREEDKAGAYVMITPDGDAYGTAEQTVDGIYPRVGSILRDHLSDLARAVQFRREPNERRYQTIDAKLQEKQKALAQPHPGVPSDIV